VSEGFEAATEGLTSNSSMITIILVHPSDDE
jgi:hypothetical protein